MRPGFLPPLSLATVFTLALVSASSNVVAPTSAFVVKVGPETPDVAVVGWTAVVDADYYNVYGYVDGVPEHVATTEATLTYVIGDYSAYAVTAVVDGVESAPTFAEFGTCIRPQVGVPPVVVYPCGSP